MSTYLSLVWLPDTPYIRRNDALGIVELGTLERWKSFLINKSIKVRLRLFSLSVRWWLLVSHWQCSEVMQKGQWYYNLNVWTLGGNPGSASSYHNNTEIWHIHSLIRYLPEHICWFTGWHWKRHLLNYTCHLLKVLENPNIRQLLSASSNISLVEFIEFLVLQFRLIQFPHTYLYTWCII